MPVWMYDLNASWKESLNVMVSGWYQKEFSRQMRMATGGQEEVDENRRDIKKKPNQPAKTVREGVWN